MSTVDTQVILWNVGEIYKKLHTQCQNLKVTNETVIGAEKILTQLNHSTVRCALGHKSVVGMRKNVQPAATAFICSAPAGGGWAGWAGWATVSCWAAA